jgi:hypothetical protein
MAVKRCEIDVLASERRQRFFKHIRSTYPLQPHQLVHIIRARERYSPLVRVAALRNLICSTSVEITQGRSYLDRRRLVRHHFGV